MRLLGRDARPMKRGARNYRHAQLATYSKELNHAPLATRNPFLSRDSAPNRLAFVFATKRPNAADHPPADKIELESRVDAGRVHWLVRRRPTPQRFFPSPDFFGLSSRTDRPEKTNKATEIRRCRLDSAR
jgi:hypothetical protein